MIKRATTIILMLGILLVAKALIQPFWVLSPSGSNLDDNFGWAIVIDSNIAFIGSIGDDENGGQSGAVYLFEFDSTSWIETGKILAPDGGPLDYFGGALDKSSEWLVIGAHNDSSNGGASGSAYVFQEITDSFVFHQKLVPIDIDTGFRFGFPIKFNDSLMHIGAHQADGDTFTTGAIYVFEQVGFSWTQKQKVFASDGESLDGFGTRFDIFQEYMLIGANGDDDIGTVSGAAYIFQYNGSQWVETQKLHAFDGQQGDQFGRGVAIYGNWAAIGSIGDDDFGTASGSVYMYKYDSTSSQWLFNHKLYSATAEPFEFFGNETAIFEDRMIIGNSQWGNNGYGALYLFEFCAQGNQWQQTGRFGGPPYSFSDDMLGLSVYLDDKWFAGSRISGYGQAVIFNLDSIITCFASSNLFTTNLTPLHPLLTLLPKLQTVRIRHS